MSTNFGSYIVYVDESGDHNLVHGNDQYPLFVLAFCIFRIDEYAAQVVPAVEQLKFKYFGHDMVVLHEREIRKSLPPFQILRERGVHSKFMTDLSEVIDSSPFTIVASAIKKRNYVERGYTDENPYHVALEFGLERVYMHLQAKHQRGKKIAVVFESRGRNEDRDLELEFRRIMDRTRMKGMADTLTFLCANKQANSSGLQLADMVARPIGMHILRPDQRNRAYELIAPKLRSAPNGTVHGYGLKVFP